jgi:hypothetical protein
MSDFNQIKPLSDEINTLLLSIKDIKPNLYKEYTLVVDESINDFIDLGADYIEKNPQEFKIFLSKLNDIIKILNFIKDKENISELKLTHILRQLLEEKKEDRCKRIADRRYDKPSAYKSGAIVRCRQGKIWKDLKEEELTEDESLHKWFKRKGTPGKEGGWVDCNTCRNGKCKPCGRKEGEDRAKYPSCRPTPSQCKTKGKGKKWGKTK